MDHEARRMSFRSGFIDEMVTANPLSQVVEPKAFEKSSFLLGTAAELESSPGQVCDVWFGFEALKELRLLFRDFDSCASPTCK